MDFSLSETQEELVGLAKQILADHTSLAQLKAAEQSAEGFDRAVWQEFANSDLLGIAIPEAQGGLGLGFLDLCMAIRAVGAHVAPLPVIPCLVSAVLPWVRFGTPDQHGALARIASGEIITTAALSESGAAPHEPMRTVATPNGSGYRIDGAKTAVPFADIASGMLVPCRVAGGAGSDDSVGSDDVVMLSVATNAPGLTLERQIGQNYEHLFEATFAGVEVGESDVLGTAANGREILAWTLDRTMVAMCALISGVCDAALRITAQYTIDRKQFDRQIGTFQAVSQRMADTFINNQGIELTMLQAATHLDEGREVPEEVAVAKWWACEGGNQIGHAALHVHGGISIDLDYPIHRHFLWIKQAEFTLGSATPQLKRLGAMLAG